MAHKKQHEWDWLGEDSETGDYYAHCRYCNKLCKNPDGNKAGEFITRKFYNERVAKGVVVIDGTIVR